MRILKILISEFTFLNLFVAVKRKAIRCSGFVRKIYIIVRILELNMRICFWLVIVAIVVLAGCGGTQQLSSDSITYTNDEFGFSVDYPSNWKVQALSDDALFVEFDNNVMRFYVATRWAKNNRSSASNLEAARMYYLLRAEQFYRKNPSLRENFEFINREINKSFSSVEIGNHSWFSLRFVTKHGSYIRHTLGTLCNQSLVILELSAKNSREYGEIFLDSARSFNCVA